MCAAFVCSFILLLLPFACWCVSCIAAILLLLTFISDLVEHLLSSVVAHNSSVDGHVFSTYHGNSVSCSISFCHLSIFPKFSTLSSLCGFGYKIFYHLNFCDTVFSRRNLHNVTKINRLCSLLFKITSLHHCREHRTVCDPSISIQHEEACK